MSVQATWADGTTQTYDNLTDAYKDFAERIRKSNGLPKTCVDSDVLIPYTTVKIAVLDLIKNASR